MRTLLQLVLLCLGACGLAERARSSGAFPVLRLEAQATRLERERPTRSTRRWTGRAGIALAWTFRRQPVVVPARLAISDARHRSLECVSVALCAWERRAVMAVWR